MLYHRSIIPQLVYLINNYTTVWLSIIFSNYTTVWLSIMTSNVINYIGAQHGPYSRTEVRLQWPEGHYQYIPPWYHGMVPKSVWFQNMVPKLARPATVGTLEQLVLWNIGMVGISYFGTLEQLVLWYGWNSWDRILESSLSAPFLCQHHFFVNDTSLSAPFLCQHHFSVSYMLLSATHLCQ